MIHIGIKQGTKLSKMGKIQKFLNADCRNMPDILMKNS